MTHPNRFTTTAPPAPTGAGPDSLPGGAGPLAAACGKNGAARGRPSRHDQRREWRFPVSVLRALGRRRRTGLV